MDELYTRLSRMAFDQAMEPSLDTEDVYSALAGIRPRSFADILQKHAQGAEIRSILLQGLLANDPARKRDSVERNIRDWLSGKRAPKPSDRGALWEFCFVLKLDTAGADDLLAAAGETGIHWRDPRELAYAFALKKGWTYPEAKAFYTDRVCPILPEHTDDAQNTYTTIAREQFCTTDDEAELISFIQDNAAQLGTFHNRAWQRFTSYLQELQQPETFNGMDEKKMTARDVLAEYFCTYIPTAQEDRKASGVNLPSKREVGTLSPIHRVIMDGWPDEIEISRIRNREPGADVPRKALMLLFLATDGITAEMLDAETGFDEEDDDTSDLFCASYERMNTMLNDCGYRRLDPRNAFDWLMLYCMRVVNDDEFASDADEVLKKVLAVLFPYEDAGA